MTTPAEPMSDERIAEVRSRVASLEFFTEPRSGAVVAPSYADMRTLSKVFGEDIPDLLAEINRLRKQEQGVREVIVGAHARAKGLLDWAEDIKNEQRQTGVQAVALEARSIANRVERVLDGEVAS